MKILAETRNGTVVEIEYLFTPASHGDPDEIEILAIVDEQGNDVKLGMDEAIESMEKRALRNQI